LEKNKPISKPYKTGERPKKGDLVWRNRKGPSPKHKHYGIVVGLWISRSGNSRLPVILWVDTGKKNKSLAGSIRLAARSKV